MALMRGAGQMHVCLQLFIHIISFIFLIEVSDPSPASSTPVSQEKTLLSPLVPGQGPVRFHQEGDRGVPAVRAWPPPGETADSALQPPDGSVSTDRPAHPAGAAHTDPQTQTLGAEGVLRQG